LAAAPAVDDEIYIRDISEAAADESKRIVISNLFNTPTIASPTINGTIATTGLTLPAVTLGGSITGAAQTMTGMGTIALNTGQYVGMDATSNVIFAANSLGLNAGSGSATIVTTGADLGLIVQSTQDGTTGAALFLKTIDASPDAADVIGRIRAVGRNTVGADREYMNFSVLITDPVEATLTSSLKWELYNSGEFNNVAMTLSGAGGLAVDLDNGGTDYYVGLFDDYDDALVIKHGIQENNRELLADMGVLERKDTGSGYMMKIQPMVRLLAGGIYQSRAMIDELMERLELAEGKLKQLGAG